MRQTMMLIDTASGVSIVGPRSFDRPDDDAIIDGADPGTVWIPHVIGGRAHPRKGEQLERDVGPKPWPFDPTTVWFEGWKITGTFKPPSLDAVKDQAIETVWAWKVEKQDEDFTHTDALEYPNTARDRSILGGAVNLAILSKMTAAPGRPVPAVGVRMRATDGTVTVMDEDAIANLGQSAAAHMQGISDLALDTEELINEQLTAPAVQVALETLIPPQLP